MVNHLVPVACVLIRGVSAIQGSGLEGYLQFRVWIRGVFAIQGSGLEGCVKLMINIIFQ